MFWLAQGLNAWRLARRSDWVGRLAVCVWTGVSAHALTADSYTMWLVFPVTLVFLGVVPSRLRFLRSAGSSDKQVVGGAYAGIATARSNM